MNFRNNRNISKIVKDGPQAQSNDVSIVECFTACIHAENSTVFYAVAARKPLKPLNKFKKCCYLYDTVNEKNRINKNNGKVN